MRKRMIWLLVGLFVCLGWGVPGIKTGRDAGAGGGAGFGPQPDDGEVWVKRYDGPAHASDIPEAIAVDGAGNVFVAGGSIVGYNNWDYTTIKYGSGGTQKWVKKYGFNTSSGQMAKLDIAHAMALDTAGNIYVTGGSCDANGFSEFATIKYNTAGTKIWGARAYGWGTYSDNTARAIAVDKDRNVVVAGDSWAASGEENTKHDFLTVKYDSGGHQQWARQFDDSIHKDDLVASLGLDRLQNIYVMGRSMELNNSSDYRTIKYDPNGGVLWSIHYNGPNNGYDVPHAGKVLYRSIYILVLNEIFLTGSTKTSATKHDFLTIKYDTDGGLRWAKTLEETSGMTDIEAVGLAADSSGNVYVTGSGLCPPTKFITIKYDSNGNLKWTRVYDAGLGYNYATAIAVDGAGNVYVTGLSQDSACNSFDFATVKYDTDGNEKWVRRYDGPAHGYDWPRAIAVDNTGHVYVTGSSEGDGTKEDYLTIKYTAD